MPKKGCESCAEEVEESPAKENPPKKKIAKEERTKGKAQAMRRIKHWAAKMRVCELEKHHRRQELAFANTGLMAQANRMAEAAKVASPLYQEAKKNGTLNGRKYTDFVSEALSGKKV